MIERLRPRTHTDAYARIQSSQSKCRRRRWAAADAVAASPTWAAAPSQMSNQFSQYDMADIEYFNEVNFMGDVSLTVQQPTATTYGVLLVCPQLNRLPFPADARYQPGDLRRPSDH